MHAKFQSLVEGIASETKKNKPPIAGDFLETVA
jgi:hypothetical protein